MPEKRRTRSAGGQAKVQRATTQTTLKDLFRRTNSGTGFTEKAQDPHLEHTDPVAPLLAAVLHPPTQPSRPPKPSQLFPIFTKASSLPDRLRDTVISVDDTDVIDITDTSSSLTDLSTESPSSSTHQLSPRSEFNHAASHSPSSSSIVLDTHFCESATSLPHAGTHEHTHPHKASKDKGLKARTLGSGHVVPLPGSCSQHVRGFQHSYTSAQAPIKRRVLPSFRPSDEGSLDFLKKWQQLDGIPSTPLDHIDRSLTPQQCEERLQSLSRDYVESHPAFARISAHQEGTPLRHAEAWTRRFRPRRANEVLGNEQNTTYLRDWLSALELHLCGRLPDKPEPKDATARENKGKNALKRVEPRGVKRPHVTRAVTRKGNKKRRVDSDEDLDDFVVFSDADEDQADGLSEDSEDELAFCQRTLTRLHRRDTADAHEPCPLASNTLNRTTSQIQESAGTNFTDNLTNTILLTGPPGCGKTAAVYACAEELGWDVFEVYPGIGRRNGANLEHLVGDVGKNHIVQTVHKCAPAKGSEKGRMGLRGYLAKSKAGQITGSAKTREAGTQSKPICVEVESPTDELAPLALDQEMHSSGEVGISGMCHGSRPIVRQSLVLLEEVDILFKEDGGFWPAVVDFIQCCQRPVVMTCNDLGLVPIGDLPVQKVLVFEPCPSMVAATFLQCVSLREGCLVPHEDLMVLYESTHSIDGAEGPLYPRTEPLLLPDLRRSITQLQMLCAGGRHGATRGMQQGEEAEGHVRRSARPISAECRVTPMGSTVEGEWWRKMKSHGELMSHVDAELCGRVMSTWEVVLGEEEETGYVMLSSEGVVCDELIAEEAIRYSRGIHEESATGPIEASINPAARLTREEFRARVDYQSRMAEALQGMVEAPAPLMPQGSVFLDYIPWVRYMVTVDDILERRAWDGMGTDGGVRRWTRNSMRTRHARTVLVSDRQRDILRRSIL